MPNHLFFDLDHTLWDFEANAEETLKELYELYKIQFLAPTSSEEFIAIYSKINHDLWKLYRNHQITKASLRVKRFEDTFKALGVENRHMPKDIGEKYVEICPTKTALIPGARETLEYLQDRYELHIITNGFEESQNKKLKYADLGRYFKTVTISEHVGKQKPHPLVFETALKNAQSKLNHSTYIGDNLDADVKGAINAGWKAFWLCKPDNNFVHRDCTIIRDLRQLKQHF
ncbi:MAG: YjjG family noncanonical pyrimidine nucleotidase [Bacteroidia bacterium]|nr:YjjG family noncanonical pyrimidine nucleotidase [Bacteroidia bacterium]